MELVPQREVYTALKADESLSEQGKFEKAEAYRTQTEPKIVEAYEKARKTLAEQAKRNQRASIPLPDNLDLSTAKVSDSAGLLAIHGEAQAIINRIERVRDRTPKGMRSDGAAVDVLREVYASAMDDGGVEGVSRARSGRNALLFQKGRPAPQPAYGSRVLGSERRRSSPGPIEALRHLVVQPHQDENHASICYRAKR